MFQERENNYLHKKRVFELERIIVEANKYDPIWGIGMFSDDRNLLRTELWGQNLLGKAIMKVREELKKS
jgi:ribA/ribD-fused uncharacterized protein